MGGNIGKYIVNGYLLWEILSGMTKFVQPNFMFTLQDCKLRIFQSSW